MFISIQSRGTDGVRGWEVAKSTRQGEAHALRLLAVFADGSPWLNWRAVAGDGVYSGRFELVGSRPARTDMTMEELVAERDARLGIAG